MYNILIQSTTPMPSTGVPFFEHVLCNRLSYHCQNSKIIKISSVLKNTLSTYYAKCWGGIAYTKGGWGVQPWGFIFQLRLSVKQGFQQHYDLSGYKVVGVHPRAKELKVTAWALCLSEGINRRRGLQWKLGRSGISRQEKCTYKSKEWLASL